MYVVFYGRIDTKEETDAGVTEQPINHSSFFCVCVAGNSFRPECNYNDPNYNRWQHLTVTILQHGGIGGDLV